MHQMKKLRVYSWENKGIMNNTREFVSFCRKLLRVIEKIEKYLENGETEEALTLIRELKEDTQKDIEA